jgi:hypothetical protein
MSRALLKPVVETQRRRRSGRATRISIDVDSSVDPTQGEQQQTFFNGQYYDLCYLPPVPMYGSMTSCHRFVDNDKAGPAVLRRQPGLRSKHRPLRGSRRSC